MSKKLKNPKKKTYQPSLKLNNQAESAYVRGTAKRDEGRTPSTQEATDLALLKRVADHIEIHYPGHQWSLNVSHDDGILKISIPLFMGSVNWYAIPLKALASDPGFRLVTNGCGEILERLGLPRSALKQTSYMDLMERFPKHRKGTVYGDLPK